MEPVDQAREAFTAGVDLCLSASDPLFLLRVRRLVEITQADPLLERCMREAIERADRGAAEFTRRDEALRADLRALRADLERDFPFLADAIGRKEGEEAYEDSLAQFDDLDLERRPRGTPMDPGEDGALTEALADVLVAVGHRVVAERGKDSEEAQAAKRRALRLRRVRAALFEDIQDFGVGDPGAVWVLVNRTIEHFRRTEIDIDGMEPNQLLRLMFHEAPVRETIRKVMYRSGSPPMFGDTPTAEDRSRFKNIREVTSERLQLLKADVLWQLNTKVSREWVIRRYVERSVRLRAEELRQLIRRQKKPEETLVAEAAGYLFDQGLDVWTEVTIGAQRLDLVGKPGPGAFVVEAKIYRNPSKGKDAVRTGLNQLWSYATTLEPTLSTIEGFLLVYRLGGRKLVLPPWVVKNGRRFAIVHVELGKAKDTGHNAPPAMPVAPTDIGVDIFEGMQAAAAQQGTPAPSAPSKARQLGATARKPARAPRARGR
jgi:hypothetical protein